MTIKDSRFYQAKKEELRKKPKPVERRKSYDCDPYLTKYRRPNRRFHPLPGTLVGEVICPPTGTVPLDFDACTRYVLQDIRFNRPSVARSKICGCIKCLNFFPPYKVTKYDIVMPDATADTAICPICGETAVLPSDRGWPMSAPFLLAMRERIYPRLRNYTDPNTRVYASANERADDFLRRCNEDPDAVEPCSP